MACVGGDDQIKLLRYLNAETFRENPKPYFGYSDNTHLSCYLWKLGIPSFYGGSVLTQLAMQGQILPETVASLNWAFFEHGLFELKASAAFADEDLAWEESANLKKYRKMEPNDGFYFDGDHSAEGRLWGGCIESLDFMTKVPGRVPELEHLAGTILFLESSEEIPSHECVKRFMIALGEWGLLKIVKGLVVGRPKAWFFDRQLSPVAKQNYRKEQREVMLEVFREYNPLAPIVMNVDFGHTDPQLILPNGGLMKIDGVQKKVWVSI